MAAKAGKAVDWEVTLDRWTMREHGNRRRRASFVGGAGPVIMLRVHETDPAFWRYEVRDAVGLCVVSGLESGTADVVARHVVKTFIAKEKQG